MHNTCKSSDLLKIFIFVMNCVYLIRHIIKNSTYELSCGTWIATCIVDACFSLQILISVLFHLQDFNENSILVFNMYLMLYLSFDTMLNLIVLLLTVKSINPYSIRNDETLELVRNDDSSKMSNRNSKTKSIRNLHQLLFCNWFERGNNC